MSRLRQGPRPRTVWYGGQLYELSSETREEKARVVRRVQKPVSVKRPIGFYRDREERIRPITPRVGRVKGALVSQRYRPRPVQVQRVKMNTLRNPMLYRNLMAQIQKQVDPDSFDKIDWDSELDLTLEPKEALSLLKTKYPNAFKEEIRVPTKKEQREIIEAHQEVEAKVEKQVEEARSVGQILTPEEELKRKQLIEQREFVKSLGNIDDVRKRDVRALYSLKWKLKEHSGDTESRDALLTVERVITEKEYPEWSKEKRSFYVKTLMDNLDQSRHGYVFPIQEYSVLDTSHIQPNTFTLHYRIDGSWHNKDFDSYEDLRKYLRQGRAKEYVHPLRGTGEIAWVPRELPKLPKTIGKDIVETPKKSYTVGQTSMRDEDRQWTQEVSIWDKEKSTSRRISMREDDWQVLKESIQNPIPKMKTDTHKVKIERGKEERKPSMLKGETLEGPIERGRVHPLDTLLSAREETPKERAVRLYQEAQDPKWSGQERATINQEAKKALSDTGVKVDAPRALDKQRSIDEAKAKAESERRLKERWGRVREEMRDSDEYRKF